MDMEIFSLPLLATTANAIHAFSPLLSPSRVASATLRKQARTGSAR